MDRARAASSTAIIAVLGYCGALVSISQTVSLPLLPLLPDELDTSVSNVSWVATAAFLTGAVANPVFGRMGDMYGKRRMVIVALAALAAGCVIAALSSNVLGLVLGRALQGCGIAVIPLGMSIAKETLPPDKTSQGVALVSATLGIGGGLGLPLAGVLVGWYSWQSVFWVTTGLTLVALVLAIAILPTGARRSSQPFDVVGAVWLSACLVAILLPLSKSASWGWLRPLPLTLFVVGFAGLVGWSRYERRPTWPLIDVQLMRQRPLVLVNTAGLLLGFAMFTNMYGSIALLQAPETVAHGFGASVVLAGMIMLPGALAMMATSPISAWITDHHGARVSLLAGSAIMALGYLTRLGMLGSLWAIGLSVAVVNAGVGIAYGAMPSAIMAHVPDSETASANAVGTLARATGASLSSAAVAAILTSITIDVGGDALPGLGAFQLTFLLSAGAAIAAAVLAYRLPRTPPLERADEPVVVVSESGTTVVSRIPARRA